MEASLEAIRILMAAHYHLMDNPRYWYEGGDMDASRILCVAASDMRCELRKVDGKSER